MDPDNAADDLQQLTVTSLLTAARHYSLDEKLAREDFIIAPP